MPDFATEAIELHESRSGSPFNSDMHREYSLTFKVVTTNKLLGSNAVCRCPGVPTPFSPYVLDDGEEYDLAARAVRHTATKVDSDDPFVWHVRVDYSTKMPPGGIPDLTGFGWDAWGSQNNPELVPPVIRWDKETENVARPYDLDKRPFHNAAGQPLSPAPTVPTGRSVLVITRNELEFGPETTCRYAYAVNSDKFLKIGEPGTVRCDPPTAEEDFIGEIHFWRVTYRLVFNYPKYREQNNENGQTIINEQGQIVRPAGRAALEKVELQSWQPEYLNQGVMQKASIGPIAGIPIPIIRHGVPTTTPVLLNENGVVQNERDDNGNLIPTYISRRVYQARSFTRLLRGTFGRL